MLVFMDESYEQDGTGRVRHVYAGFGIHEGSYRALVAALHQGKLRYCADGTGLTAEQRDALRLTHILTAGSPEKAEVKAQKLLGAGKARHHMEFGNAPGLLMAEHILDALAATHATVFGVLSHPVSDAAIRGDQEHLPQQYIRLLERVEAWMAEQHPDGAAVMVFDTVHNGCDLRVSRQMADFLFRSKQGQAMRHIVCNPFWVDSTTTAGSQAADLVAHILMNSMRPATDRKPLAHLWQKVASMEFRSVDMKTRGIRQLRKETTDGSSRSPVQ